MNREYDYFEEGNDPDDIRDIAFNRHSMNDGTHISPYSEGYFLRGVAGLGVRLLQGIDEEQLRITLSRAIRATNGVSIEEPYEPDDWEEMMKGGLQTALETQVLVFEVEGASRALTHQLVRSRKAAFHQQSQRATWMGTVPNIRIPEPVARNSAARKAFEEAAEAAVEAYNVACDQDISYENARYILPEGTTGYILCEYSIREFLNVFEYRACSMFMTEMVYVMRLMKRALLEDHPWMEKYVKITCEKTKGTLDDGPGNHHCRFQGWEKVDDQCGFEWARETNRSFRSDKHSIG